VVEFVRRDLWGERERYEFARAPFLVAGVLPAPGVSCS
jgi:hypothetical protein